MDLRQKMGIAGVGLLATGIGLSVLGAALLAPVLAAWAERMVQHGTERLMHGAERASKTVGTVAGTLHRSFGEAAKAGLADIRKARG